MTELEYEKQLGLKDMKIKDKEVRITELERKLEQTEKDLADYQFNYPTIKELEKENAELRNNGFTVSAMTEQQLKVALEKGEQLEKENAELKHTIAELRRDKDNLNTHTKAQEKLSEYRSDQLTKAKEILHKVCYEFGIYDKDLMEEAKQFLKEEEA
ncbi:MAG: hypothetical protein J6W46_10140 [Spirochaetaceae bacterium]|nr:hypothetical protein [Spirochaetaceae bacterium]